VGSLGEPPARGRPSARPSVAAVDSVCPCSRKIPESAGAHRGLRPLVATLPDAAPAPCRRSRRSVPRADPLQDGRRGAGRAARRLSSRPAGSARPHRRDRDRLGSPAAQDYLSRFQAELLHDSPRWCRRSSGSRTRARHICRPPPSRARYVGRTDSSISSLSDRERLGVEPLGSSWPMSGPSVPTPAARHDGFVYLRALQDGYRGPRSRRGRRSGPGAPHVPGGGAGPARPDPSGWARSGRSGSWGRSACRSTRPTSCSCRWSWRWGSTTACTWSTGSGSGTRGRASGSRWRPARRRPSPSPR
jgi:hypothetical protein